ncbi:MAG: C4-dicarboxylate transporter substrate-binding protein [Cryptosporangiaceae bacterium]|jgi:putative tricarboxylic transport membrane protein|nr:C4-dicarboxylate transporter substrate-binding protein [Cryptosporangiaceae bacterium]
MFTRTVRVTAVALGFALLATGCGATATKDTGGADTTLSGTRLMVPNTAGGGYDTTARTAAKVMEDAGIASGVEVFNLPGAGGTVGLARLVNEKGDGDLAMMMGLGVVGSVYTNKSKTTLADTTPLARLIEESGAIVVSEDSPYRTLGQLVTAWKANPGKVTVGGGSSPGGPDHLLPMQLAQAVGIDPKKVNYIPYDGGGDLLPSILGNKVAFGASGYSEFLDQIKAGQVRVLAVTGEQRVDAVDAPTLEEQGVDLVFTNWRGMVAPPGLTDDARKRLMGALDRMHESKEWKAELTQRGWTDAYLTGEEFGTFLTEQDERVADVLGRLGLA